MNDEEPVGAGEVLRRVAVNLFHGYGYTYYREENNLRADDQRIRRMVSEQLQRARKTLSEAESAYRREQFPPPSREQPFPPAEAQTNARRLEALALAVSAVDGQIAHLPVPANDFMTQRFRREADTLKRLCEADVELVSEAQVLAASVEGRGYAALLAEAETVERAIAAVKARLLERQALLV